MADQPKPLKYTGARLTDYQELVVTPRLRGEARLAVIIELNKRERKAKQQKKKRDEKRRVKEEQEARERSARIARELAERMQKEKEKREARNAKRRQQRAEAKEAKKEFSVTVLVTFLCNKRVSDEGEGKTKRKQLEGNNGFRITRETTLTVAGRANIKKAVDEYVRGEEEYLKQESGIQSVKIISVDEAITEIKREKIDKKTIKMKEAQALNLDGEIVQTWDTGKGRCVYDFLIWRYGNRKGCIKVCVDEKLDKLFSKYINESDEEVTVENPQEEGVCVYQLINFSEAVGCRMYALDEDDKILHFHEPKRVVMGLPALIYKVKNNHMYAIIDNAKSIAKMGKAEFKSNMGYENKEKEEKQKLEIVVVEKEGSSMDFLINTMKKEGVEISKPQRNIRFSDSGIVSFVLNKKQYIFDEDDTIKNAQAIMKINDKEYTGETTHTLLINMLEQLEYNKKSVCNPGVFSSLLAEGVKFRTHYGIVDEQYSYKDVQQLVENGEANCYDIGKCYTACVTNPYDNWIFLNFNDTWEEYDGELKTGLYFVETNDMTLMHGSNIYSNKIIQLAIDEGIELTIVKQLLPKYIELKDYYHKLLEQIDTLCKGDKTLKKSLTNIITGFLGKHKTTKYFPKLTTDMNTVWNDFTKPEFHENETFAYKYDNYYIYGYKKHIINAETNIPHYIQILDWSNMRLYNMIKESGGKCIFRKTDCAVVLGGSVKTGEEIGEYRESELPKSLGVMRPVEERHVDRYVVDLKEWNHITTISDSDQVEDVYNLLMEKKGLINCSRAGTGKTWNCLEIEKRFKERVENPKVIKLAFTNKASMNMNGTTIHKFLKINKEGKFKLNWLDSLRNQTILFMIDEISMIGAYLWRRLVELKRYLGNSCYFLLCGDYRQAPPVEEEERDYFDSSAVKYLSNHIRIEFTVRKRYDLDLWNFAEDVYERDYTNYDLIKRVDRDDIAFLSTTANICYYNKTRKYVNARINSYVATSKKEKIVLKYEHPEDSEILEAKALQQDVVLYAGLPIMAIKTMSDKKTKEVLCVNNESFVVEDIDQFITMSSIRTNEEGEEYKHTITCKYGEFHSMFVMKYCSTTHKQQGDTIDKNIVIFDYRCMSKNLKYTAVTRAKKLSQIHIV